MKKLLFILFSLLLFTSCVTPTLPDFPEYPFGLKVNFPYSREKYFFTPDEYYRLQIYLVEIRNYEYMLRRKGYLLDKKK